MNSGSHPSGKKVGIEIKFSVAPKPARGFWQSLKDLQISTAWVLRRYSAAIPWRGGWK